MMFIKSLMRFRPCYFRCFNNPKLKKHRSTLVLSKYLSNTTTHCKNIEQDSSKKDVKTKLDADNQVSQHKNQEHSVSINNIYPPKIEYREKIEDPLARIFTIVKDEFIECIRKVKHHPFVSKRKESAKEFEYLEKQIFPDVCDVVIIGGGLTGIACAYHLQEHIKVDDGLRVVVVEQDLTYSGASSKLCMGGIRQQFSLPENIILSRYGMDFLQTASSSLTLIGSKPPKFDINFHGYLCLANESQMPELIENQLIQRDCGCNTKILEKNEIKKKYPWINVDGIEAGLIGTQREGWFNPYKLLVALSLKTREYGTHFVQGKVIGTTFRDIGEKTIGIEKSSAMKQAVNVKVKLFNGDVREIKAATYIIAAGAWSKEVGHHFYLGSESGLLSWPIPVEPRKRYGFTFKSSNGPGLNCPFVVDTDGTHFRREGLADTYTCGRSPLLTEKEPEIDDLKVDDSYFEEFIKPSILNRCPSFKNLESLGSWAGYYDYNTFDQNPLIGRHPHFANLYMATGFTGHGAQQALGAGKVISDLIFKGGYETMNVEKFGFDRVILNDPLVEKCIY